VEADLDTFSHDYPSDARVDVLKLYLAKKVESSDPVKADAIFAELTKSSNQQVAAEAAGALKMRDLMKQPLNLKYTAMDGAEIDLSKMRGKVVLVDFWATWCGPCMGEVPNVVAAYKKYHDKGFEVVGISLDKDKDAVLRVTKAQGMTWPQYFDGKGWQNSISSSYGINSIPTMWLINKNGLIASTEARGNLDSEIVKLLGE
jgi:thiol-disulfide isomerase/thioredoxin